MKWKHETCFSEPYTVIYLDGDNFYFRRTFQSLFQAQEYAETLKKRTDFPIKKITVAVVEEEWSNED